MAKKSRFEDTFDRADAAFKAQYGAELEQLKGLSEEEIAAITPGTEGQEAYATLVQVVDQASKENLDKAQLASNLRAGGGMVLNLARRFVPGLLPNINNSEGNA